MSDKLSSLFSRHEELSNQMREIFIQNNIEIYSVIDLPKAERAKWFSLRDLQINIYNEINNIILKK